MGPNMNITVAIQMDHISTIDIDGDSTFVLALEAQKRGYEILHYIPKRLVMRNGAIITKAEPLTVQREKGNHFDLGEATEVNLKEIDVVLMRQDPPFDMAYITATHLLEHTQPDTLVVNNPHEVRNAPEKLFVTRFPEFMPPTLIGNDHEHIMSFRNEHKDIILKPLYGNGGAGVFHVTENDENFNALLEIFSETYREPFIVQKYLPAVREGDKRIIIIDGQVAGATNRVPALGEARSNMHVGGQAEKTKLTSREHEICEAIGPELKSRGLIFVGIDVIGGLLTEINVTSPTGLQEINGFDGTSLESEIWDAIEARL